MNLKNHKAIHNLAFVLRSEANMSTNNILYTIQLDKSKISQNGDLFMKGKSAYF